MCGGTSSFSFQYPMHEVIVQHDTFQSEFVPLDYNNVAFTKKTFIAGKFVAMNVFY